jgi:hypothetical protein
MSLALGDEDADELAVKHGWLPIAFAAPIAIRFFSENNCIRAAIC